MHRRLFTAGAVAVLLGLAGFGVLLTNGVVRRPAATAAYAPAEIAAVGGSFFLVTAGVIVVFRSLMLAAEGTVKTRDGGDR